MHHEDAFANVAKLKRSCNERWQQSGRMGWPREVGARVFRGPLRMDWKQGGGGLVTAQVRGLFFTPSVIT